MSVYSINKSIVLLSGSYLLSLTIISALVLLQNITVINAVLISPIIIAFLYGLYRILESQKIYVIENELQFGNKKIQINQIDRIYTEIFLDPQLGVSGIYISALNDSIIIPFFSLKKDELRRLFQELQQKNGSITFDPYSQAVLNNTKIDKYLGKILIKTIIGTLLSVILFFGFLGLVIITIPIVIEWVS